MRAPIVSMALLASLCFACEGGRGQDDEQDRSPRNETVTEVECQCRCRCVEETEGLPRAGSVIFACTLPSQCAGANGSACEANADVPPGGDVDGMLQSCSGKFVKKSE